MNLTNTKFSTSYLNGVNDVIGNVSTFCFHAFSVHFYLRDKRAKRYTSIIALVRHGNNSIKISLPIQIFPAKWDKRNERLHLKDAESLMCNKQLSEIRYNIERLCLSLQNIEKVKQCILDDFMPKQKNNKMGVNVEQILRTAFRMYYEEKQEKKQAKQSTINDRQKRLNKLCRIIKQMGVIESREFLINGYGRLKDYVVDYYCGYTSGANNMCEQYAMLLNHIRNKPDFEKYGIKQIEHKRFNVQQSFKTSLNEDEIKALEDVQLDNEQENNARYLFLIESECGSRNCDLAQVIENLKNLEIGKVKAYKETKEGRTAVAVNTEKMKFYISQLTDKAKDLDCNRTNQLLKVLAEKANLCRLIETMNNEPLCECISTHFGRHTFITNMRKKGYSENEVIMFTGQASVEMVRKIYSHLSKEDHESNAMRVIEKRQEQQPSNNGNTQLKSLPNSIDEALDVLALLEVPPYEWIESRTDIGFLIRLISSNEQKVINRLVGQDGFKERLDKIKELFNTEAKMRERIKCLHELSMMWRKEDEKTDRIKEPLNTEAKMRERIKCLGKLSILCGEEDEKTDSI